MTRAEHSDPIFISYARKDGSRIAADMRRLLQRAGFNVWQDLISMPGGENWRQALFDAIAQSRIMILVITPAALESRNVKEEYNHARQHGTSIFPVTLDEKIFENPLAPRWLKKLDLFVFKTGFFGGVRGHSNGDVRHRLFNQLNHPPQRLPCPFTVPSLPEHFVERPVEFNEMLQLLLDEKRQNPVALTTALKGGGGFGKTTLAMALCHDPTVRWAFDDGVLWVQFREVVNDSDVLALLNKQIEYLGGKGDHIELTSASAALREQLKARDVLMVLDDVWDERYLRYFLQSGTAYLITTRIDRVVSQAKAKPVMVNQMATREAAMLLAQWIDFKLKDDPRLWDLAKRLGEWPLLLELVGAELRSLLNAEYTLERALQQVIERFETRGITVTTGQF